MTDVTNPIKLRGIDLKPGVTTGCKIIAIVGYNNDWAAYQGLVDWDNERVAETGDKISREAAEVLFPVFKWAGYRYRE